MFPEISTGNFLLFISEPTETRGYRVHVALQVGRTPADKWGPVSIEKSAFASLPAVPAFDFNSLKDAQKACEVWVTRIQFRA